MEEILQQLPQDWADSSELLELLTFTIGSQMPVTPELWNEILGGGDNHSSSFRPKISPTSAGFALPLRISMRQRFLAGTVGDH